LNIAHMIRLLIPELILLTAATAVILLDLYFRRRTSKWFLPGITIVGLLAAMVEALLLWSTKEAVAFTMAADSFAFFFMVVASGVMVIVVTASVDYMRERTRFLGEFYALLLIVTLAIFVAVSARDLILVYLGLEFVSITSYVLTGFLRHNKRSNEAAVKYFLYGAAASAVMLYGMSLLYGITGTTDLAIMSSRLLSGDLVANLNWLGWPAVVLVAVGFGFKSSLVPFHQWAPDAYDGAPTPVTMFLSTASKATGFAVMTRVFVSALPALSIHWLSLLYGLAILTMTLGNLIALRQDSVKRMLAYSSVAHAGFILMGLVAISVPGAPGSFNGIDGVLVYVLAYAVTNAGAFAVVAAVEDGMGSAMLSDFAGLMQRAPLLAVGMLIFLLSLAGVPPLAGFAAKLFVFGAAIRQEYYVLAAIALVNAVLAAGYYLRVVKQMFFVERMEASVVSVGRGMQVALWLCIVGVFAVGILMNVFARFATDSSIAMLGL